MPRTAKAPQPISKDDLQNAAIRLLMVLNTINEAEQSLENEAFLQVIYGKSLERGLASLEAVEPEIRKATRLRLGRSQNQVSSTAAQIASSTPGVGITSDEKLAESESKAQQDQAMRTNARRQAKKKQAKEALTKKDEDEGSKQGNA